MCASKEIEKNKQSKQTKQTKLSKQKNYSNDELTNMRDIIEHMSTDKQIQILRILMENNISMTENKNGTFVNISLLNNSILSELQSYISYVTTQEESLNSVENEKERVKNRYFTNNVLED